MLKRCHPQANHRCGLITLPLQQEYATGEPGWHRVKFLIIGQRLSNAAAADAVK